MTTITDRRFGVNSSIAIKVPCLAAASVNITLSGEQNVDGVDHSENDRCLVTGQDDAAENGIYNVSTGSWVRSADWNGPNDIAKGTQVNVTDGANNTGTWEVDTDNPIIVAETSIVLSMVAATVDELNNSISIAAASASSAAISAGESAASVALAEAAGAEALGDIATAESSALGDIATAESSALVNLGVAEAEGIIAITTSSDQAAIATAQAEDSALSASAASASASAASASAGNVSVFVDSAEGGPFVSSIPLLVSSSVTEATWVSIGASGSGADTIWQALDGLPSTTEWLELKVIILSTSSSVVTGLTPLSRVLARKAGAADPTLAAHFICQASNAVTSAGDALGFAMNTAKVPVSTSQIFEIRWIDQFSQPSIEVYLVGYGANS